MHVELTNGQSAELRDPTSLNKGDRDDLLASLPSSKVNVGDGGEKSVDVTGGDAMGLVNAVIAIAVESWTLELDIPSVDLGSLRKLSIADADILEATIDPYMKVLIPNFGVDPDPASPTQPSNA